MTKPHALYGLMKWVGRDEWRGSFDEVLNVHIAAACSVADVEIEDLPSIIGDDAFAMIWICALEDFMTRTLEDGRNIVDDYLKRRGWKETARNRLYIAALRSSTMSLYEVSEIVPGESFLARDLLRPGEPVRVTERSATRAMKQWDRIAGRLVRLQDKTVLSGAPLPLDHRMSRTALGLIAGIGEEARTDVADLARHIWPDADDSTFIDEIDAELPRCVAAVFSAVWLFEVLVRKLHPIIPELRNSHGDELLFATVRYTLNPETAAEDISAALSAIPVLHRRGDKLWTWMDEPTGRRSKGAGGEAMESMSYDGTTVLGTLELEGGVLVLSVNSQQRQERGRALLEPVLSRLVGAADVTTWTVDQMRASRPSGMTIPTACALSADDRHSLVRQALDRHYAKILDEPIPMLGNQTPLELAKSDAGREKVVEWLKEMENGTANLSADDANSGYDLTWLWQKLGVTDLRR